MKSKIAARSLFVESQRRSRIIEKQILLCPGPVMVSSQVKNALLHNEIGHREEEFSLLLKRARNNLSRVFGVENSENYETVIINGSGTAANESVFSSLGSETKVLVLCNGEFGERIKNLALCHQLPTCTFSVDWGVPFDLRQVEKAILQHQPDLIAMVHHETSTGMINPIEDVGQLAHQYNKMLFVDAVSSLAAHHVNVERNHITFCTSSSNKSVASVCGMSFVCGLRSAFESLEKVKSRTAYLNLYNHYFYQSKLDQSVNTPSVTVLFALDAALDELLKQGLAERIEKTGRFAKMVRDELRSLGLQFVIPEEFMSNVLTTVWLPEGVSFDQLKIKIRERGYIMYGGKGPLTGKVFQVGNIGNLTESQLLDFTKDLSFVLSMLTAVASKPQENMDRFHVVNRFSTANQ